MLQYLLLTCLLITFPFPSIDATHTHQEHIDYMKIVHREWFSACITNNTADTDNDNTIRFSTSDTKHHHHHHHVSHQPIIDASFIIHPGRNESCAAWGWFTDTIEHVGWGYLSIHTNPFVDDYVQARAAGYLEGYLTYNRIYQESLNAYNNQFNSSSPDSRITTFIQTNIAWYQGNIAKNEQKDPYWHQIGLILYQLAGMVDGYNMAQPNQNLTFALMDLLLINLNGDLSDIMPAVINDLRVDWSTMSQSDILRKQIQRGSHCSALIKWTGNELYIAHNTWANYCSMLRVFKLYELPFNNVASRTIHFSSYFGMIDSNDDFYQMREQNLVVIETTNDIANDTLYNYVTPSSVMTWIRVIIANRLAYSGKEWTEIFARYQSGTYNNQWMIVDYKQFTPNDTIYDNTLWVISQIPGFIRSADVSHILRDKTYWASFNRPYFSDLFHLAGYTALEQQYGSYLFGYHGYFRAELFEREQHHIYAISDMQYVMQLNNWKHDPLAKNNSGFAISARYDLAHFDPAPSTLDFYVGAWGGIDTKITSYEWMQDGRLRTVAISGPTHQENPPFEWIPRWTDTHLGHPQIFNFNWTLFSYHEQGMKQQQQQQQQQQQRRRKLH